MEYNDLRGRCIHAFGFHPDEKGTIEDLWYLLNNMSSSHKIPDRAAGLLFATIARFCDERRLITAASLQSPTHRPAPPAAKTDGTIRTDD